MFDEEPDGDPHGECAEEIRRLGEENERLRTALRFSTNGLRHCSRWNISDEKEKLLMAVVMENEAILKTHNAGVSGAAHKD